MAAKKCLICNSAFIGRRDAKTCSTRCRKRLQKVRLSFGGIPAASRRPLAKTLLFLGLVLLSIFSVLFGHAASPVKAATSSTLNFQARLLDISGSVVADGRYNIRFKIYDGGTQGGPSGTGQSNSGTGGTYLWTESYYDLDGNSGTSGDDYRVRVVNGYLSVNLGARTALSGINWDQELWLTMDVGGTTVTATPTYNGEMTNSNARIKLTAVPYAFSANQLVNGNGSGRATLSFASMGQATAITLPDPASGTATVCYQSATACGFAASSGSANYIQNQNSGQQTSSNFWISGTGRADTKFTAPAFDVASAGTLDLGNSTATAVSICSSANCDTLTLAGGSDQDTINIGDTNDSIGITGATTTISGYTSGSADAFVVTNSTSTGNIANFKDNSTSVFSLADGGAALFENSTDSAAAFQIENAIGSGALVVDTTAINSLLTNTSFENSSVATWTYSGATGGSVSRTTSQKYLGNASLSVTTGTTAAAFDGVKSTLNSTLSTSTTYSISWYDTITSGTFTDVIARFSWDGSTVNAQSCSSINSQTVSTSGWTRHTCTFTTGSGGAAPNSSNAIFIVQQGANGGTQRTFYVDAVQVEQASAASAYKETGINLNGLIVSPVAFKAGVNSTSAFAVQNSAGANLLVADTINQTLIVQAKSGQSADIFEIKDSSGTILARFNSNGGLGIGNGGAIDGGVWNQFNVDPLSGPALRIKATSASNFGTLFDIYSQGSSKIFSVDASSTSGGNVVVGNAGVTDDGGLEGGLVLKRGVTNPSSDPTNAGLVFVTASIVSNVPIDSLAFHAGSSELYLSASGDKLLFGSGGDTNLYKSAADKLKTDDTFISGVEVQTPSIDRESAGALTIGNTTATSVSICNSANCDTISIGTNTDADTISIGDSGDLVTIGGTAANSLLTLGTNTTTAAGGLTFGTDTNLYRSGSGALSTDGIFTAGGASYIQLNAGVLTGGASGGSLGINASSTSNGNITIAPYGAGGGLYLNYGGTSNNGGVKIYDGGSSNLVASVSGTGAALFKNSANSTTAFQIQNAAGAKLFGVDSSVDSSNLVTNGSFETGTTGWAALGGTTISQDSNLYYIGSYSLTEAGGSSSPYGMKYNVALTSSTTYTLSMMVARNGLSVTFEMGRSEDGSTNTSCASSSLSLSTNFQYFTCTFTTGTVSGTTYIYAAQSTSTGRTFNIDAVKLEQASSATPYRESTLSLNGVINSPAIFSNTFNSEKAFEVQNNTGYSLLNVNTLSNTVNIGAVGTTSLSSTVNIATSTATQQALSIGSNYSSSTVNIESGTAATAIQIGNGATDHGIQIGTGAAVQTVVIGSTNTTSTTTIQGGTGNINLTTNSASASVIVKSSTNSTTAFQIQNANSASLFNVDTSTSQNLLTVPSFENSDVSAWVKHSTGETLARVTTYQYAGNASLKVVTSATANDGLKQNVSLSALTTYALSFYVKPTDSSLTTLQIGSSQDGSTDTSCATAQSAAINVWTKISCTFTTSETPTGTTYIYIKQTDASSHTFYVDAAQLEKATNMLTNPGAESAISGNWTALSNSSATRSTTAGHFNGGVAGIDVTSVGGAQSNVGIKNSAALSSNTTYTFSIYAEAVSSGFSTLQMGRAEDGSTNTSCQTAMSVVTTSFTKYSCTFTTGTVSGSPYVYVLATDSSSRTYYVDTAYLYQGTNTSSTSFQLGKISLDGVISSPVSFRNSSDSNTAFQLQNSNGVSVISIDTNNSLINVGGTIVQTPVNPVFVGGADSTTGAGTDQIFASQAVGRYSYVIKTGNAGTCNSSTPTGCELQVFDISVPSSPTFVGGADTDGAGTETVNSLSLQGKYLYLVKNNNTGTCNASTRDGCELQVYNIANPSSPTYAGFVDLGGNRSGNTVQVAGRYMYVGTNGSGATSCTSTIFYSCEFQVYDISNPTSPTIVAGVDAYSSANTGSVTIAGIYVQGDYAYVARNGDPTACTNGIGQYDGCEFLIINVSTPTSPSVVGWADSQQSGGGVSTFLYSNIFVQGRYAYLVRDGSATTCSAANYDGCEFQIWDVSNPAAPAYKGGMDGSDSTSGIDSMRNLFVAGNYAYITKNGNTNTCSLSDRTGCEFQVYDVSSPTSPTYSGGIDNAGASSSANSRGIFLNGRYAYVTRSGVAGTCSSSSQVGCELQVYDLSGVQAVSVSAGSLEAGVLNVDTSGYVGGDLKVQGGISVGQSIQAGGSLGVAGNFLVQGSTSFGGGIYGGTTINALTTPTAPTLAVTGANNSITRGYKIAAVSANGGVSPASSETTTAASATALDTSNYITIRWPMVTGAVAYKVYRTTAGGTPATTGLIATVSTNSFSDMGSAGDSGVAPTADTSGDFTARGNVLFKNTLNSTTAFQVQSSGSTAVFTVDTSGNKISVGTSDTTGSLLILDTDTDVTFRGSTTTNGATEIDGAIFYDSTDHAFLCGVDTIWQSCSGMIGSNTAASTAVNSCTTACASFDNGRFTIPASYLQPGKTVHLVAKGVYSTTATPTLSMGVYFGSSTTKASDTVLGAASTLSTTTVNNAANQYWELDFTINCYTTGAPGTVSAKGTFSFVTNSTTGATTSIAMNSSSTTSYTTTSAQTIYLFPEWGANNASNTITAQQIYLKTE